MTKFKAGDLLKVKDDAGPEHWRGQNGLCIVVLQPLANGMAYYDYKVLLDDMSRICFYENELELMNKGSGNE